MAQTPEHEPLAARPGAVVIAREGLGALFLLICTTVTGHLAANLPMDTPQAKGLGYSRPFCAVSSSSLR